LSPLSRMRPSGLRVPRLAETSSASSRTKFMNSSKPTRRPSTRRSAWSKSQTWTRWRLWRKRKIRFCAAAGGWRVSRGRARAASSAGGGAAGGAAGGGAHDRLGHDPLDLGRHLSPASPSSQQSCPPIRGARACPGAAKIRRLGSASSRVRARAPSVLWIFSGLWCRANRTARHRMLGEERAALRRRVVRASPVALRTANRIPTCLRGPRHVRGHRHAPARPC
jgi:hypothetical protein